jgi:hypothetical protein
VVGTTCLAAFIGQVDASIVQLALPALEQAFDAPLHAVSWVAVGYVLAFARSRSRCSAWAAATPLRVAASSVAGRSAIV